MSEAFHLLTRALGELPAPAAHEVLRARMAALHGREDVLLEPIAFLRLLRQANDAEVADVRLVSEGEYEVSPHKSDLAMQVRPMPDPNAVAGSTTALPTRPAAALRYRSGSQATKRGGQLAMVGVVQLDGETPAVVEVTSAAVAAAPTAAAARKAANRGAKPKPKAPNAPGKKAAPPKAAKAAKAVKPAAKSSSGKSAGRKPAAKPKAKTSGA